MAKLFLSYRHLDTGAYAGRLAERLRAFQFESVFYDREGIVLGANYADEIRSALGGCDAVLVLIGGDWIDARRDDGGRRLDDSADWVRREVGLAMSLGVPIVPVLFDGAKPPAANDLSADLLPLATAQGYEISGKYFERDADFLARELERQLVGRGRHPQRNRTYAATAARHFLMMLILLTVVTIVVAITPRYFPPFFWLFPAAMTLPVFLRWLSFQSELLRVEVVSHYP